MKYLRFISVYFLIFFNLNLNAGSIVQLKCNVPDTNISFIDKVKQIFKSEVKMKELIIATGLRGGHSKHSAKNNLEPSRLYYDLKTNKFTSRNFKKDSFIEIAHFINGSLLVPECQGSVIKYGPSGHFD